jgi:hypothetical protein
MKFERVTTEKEIVKLFEGTGLRVEVSFDGSLLKSLTFCDKHGVLACVERQNTYESLFVSGLAKPKMVKKFRLSGTIAGLKVDETFESDYEARHLLEKLEGIYDHTTLSVSEVEVPEE